MDEIREDNETISRLYEAYQVRQHMVHFTIFRGPAAFCSVDILGTTTLAELTKRALGELAVEDGESCIDARLRVYDQRQSIPGKTFGGRETETLAQLGLTSGGALMLEVRFQGDDAFTEFNPNQIFVQLQTWNSQNLCVDAVDAPWSPWRANNPPQFSSCSKQSQQQMYFRRLSNVALARRSG